MLVPTEVGSEVIKQLTREDLNGVHHQWLHIVTVSFDNSELMAINGKLEVGIARDRHEAEAIARNVECVTATNARCATKQTDRLPC